MSAEVRHTLAGSSWVCPNDRQLALRAKLRTGWSVKTSSSRSVRKPSPLDAGEKDVIVGVIQKAETFEKSEQMRVGRLVERLENMKRHAIGNGITSCILCAEKFGLLTSSKYKCRDCGKAVCSKCVVETVSVLGAPILLCKICAESRELWKKSGAWFFSCMPQYQLPEKKPAQSGSRRRALEEQQRNNIRSPSRYNWARNISNSSSESAGRLTPAQSLSARTDSSGDQAPVTASCDVAGDSSSDDEPQTGRSSVRRVTIYERTFTAVSQPSETTTIDEQTTPSGMPSISCQKIYRSAPLLYGDRASSIADPSTPSRRHCSARRRYDSAGSAASQGGSISDASSESSADTRSASNSGQKTLPSSIEFSLLLNASTQTLNCCIHSAKDVWPVYRDGSADSYVKLHLVPTAQKTNKLRTRTVADNLNPVFDETLIYHNVTESVVSTSSLQLTVLDEDRYGHDVLGECRVVLSKLSPQQLQRFSCPLLPIRGGRLGRVSGVYRGNLLLSLKYVTARQTLLVGVIRCSALTCADPAGQVDAFAKVQLRPGTFKYCTTVKWRCTTAEFNEEFVLPCRRQQLPRAVLDIRVYDKDIGRSNELLGYLQLSIDSRGERLRHWFDALQYPDRRHDRWHRLSSDQPAQLPN